VQFINVGQGDCTLVTIGDKAMLIDGGPYDAGPTVVSYLEKSGIDSIDVLIATHPHEDHIGGLLAVLDDIPVKQVIDSGLVSSTPTYRSYLELIDQKDIPYQIVERGDTIGFDPEVTVEVLSPPPGMVGNKSDEDYINDNSLALKITYNGLTFLLMGDTGFDAENSLLASGIDLKSDVLKVGHHGTRYSTGREFLAQVDPELSIIDVGVNDYGYPKADTLNRLEASGSGVMRTDLDGNIVITAAQSGNGFLTYRQPSQVYDTPSMTVTAAPYTTALYLGNSNSMKFHCATCENVQDIAPHNVVQLSSREDAISKGYVPCKACNP
jgi:competence protein ComEC